jgi:hypothetical protein
MPDDGFREELNPSYASSWAHMSTTDFHFRYIPATAQKPRRVPVRAIEPSFTWRALWTRLLVSAGVLSVAPLVYLMITFRFDVRPDFTTADVLIALVLIGLVASRA